MRTYRLTNEPWGLGLSCTPAGLSLAGAPLLEKTEAGFVPRSALEIASLIEAAYDADGGSTRLESSLGAIARALNAGDLARAMTAAVLTRTPELSSEGAARLAKVDEGLTKFNPYEPRDWRGRWTTGGAVGPAIIAAPVGEDAARPEAGLIGPHLSNPEHGAPERDALLTPIAAMVSDGEADDEDSREPTSLEQAFERKYDGLGPVEFAKQVIQFGDRLGREGKNLSPVDKDHALAEYSFLQGRLSFWLAYDYKPAVAHGNLLSAALTLYQGAVDGGIVGPSHLPQSMLDVVGGAWAFDNLPPRIRPSTKPNVDIEPAAPGEAHREVEGLGEIVDNSEVGIKWNEGVKDQGRPLEAYIGKQNPAVTELPATSKTFDHFNGITGEAISAKTMNTLSVTYIKNPQKIYGRLSGYIHAAAVYRPRSDFDLDPTKIQSRTIQLAIPEYTSPTQWRYLFMAIRYAREQGVSFVITRIRE